MIATGSIDIRRLACEFLIAGAVCGAAYYFLAQSVHTKVAQVRAEVAKAQAQEAARAGVGSLSDGQVHDLQHATAERLAEIRTRSAPATDESTMFARISELASTHALRVEQLNPTRPAGPIAPQLPTGVKAGTPAAQGSAPADPAAPAAPRDTSVAYSLTVTGSYSDLGAFLNSLSDKLGYTLIRAVRISQPDSTKTHDLRATIDTEHFAFDISSIKIPATPAPSTPADPIQQKPDGQAAAGE